MIYELKISIDTDKESQDLHIRDNKGGSVNYGDSNYSEGMTINSIARCIKEHLIDMDIKDEL